MKDAEINKHQERIDFLQDKLSTTEDLLQKVLMQLSIAKLSDGERKYANNMLQIFYRALTEQGVAPHIAEAVLEDVARIEDTEKIDINLIVKIVYNKIISILGDPQVIHPHRSEGESQIVVFIGPTGVGKTTTIAKLSSEFILDSRLRVGLVTADTYRIAAVEQLKTYADILGITVAVAYERDDMTPCIESLRKTSDIILIDTAGRSHKNMENVTELSELLAALPDSERFLVLSLTTKYDDLVGIIQTYEAITDFRLIFTKLDETNCLGTILNICYTTGKRISYITNGQNVPEDIEIMNPALIARALLGLGGESK
jgi:flagellar biosynthesis protein FlhF